MKEKIVNILMWIPFIGIVLGFAQMFFENNWFDRMRKTNPPIIFLNCLVLGLPSGIIIGFLIDYLK